mmetsp:Transcript_23561/g.42152  ORF Transcript_23561/g.42152 Transcript_23561/m.42152 type:complete len:231 (-) Transcript_23561:298-990(-)
MREPKITIPRRRLNPRTYRAFVDNWTVLAMTMTGSTSAGFLKARNILVSRIRRSTTKPPPSASSYNKDTSAGRMAARSITLEGVRINAVSLVTGEFEWSISCPTTSWRSRFASKISGRTPQQEHSRMTYSETNTNRHSFSITSKVGWGTGFLPSANVTWHSGIVDRMKQKEDSMITERTSTDTIWPSLDASGESKVRYILSHIEILMVMSQCLYTEKNSAHVTKPSEFSS